MAELREHRQVCLKELVETSAALSATRSRLAKIRVLSELLTHTSVADIEVAVSYLAGELRQRRAGIGWAAFRDSPPPAASSTLSLAEVDLAFARLESVSGSGAAGARRQELHVLLRRATAEEQSFMQRLVAGELRQGAMAGVMADAIAAAWNLDSQSVRRATMLSGSLSMVALAAAQGGSPALESFRLVVGTPVQPMLAQTASSLDEAIERVGRSSVEWKLDGVRVQVHRNGDSIEVFSRTLDRVTERVPEVVDAARTLSVRTAILDGETIALSPDRRPRPFQVTGSRVASGASATVRSSIPLSVFFFDVLHADGVDLIDRALVERLATLSTICPPDLCVPRVSADSGPDARNFAADALRLGHEGIMVKALESTYEAGRRGTGWIKVKPHHTLDLVVLAVERGHGRREGWLSNLHLGARDSVTGEFVMLGKTFKGLTDNVLRWQTERLQSLAIKDDGWTVFVAPELVVEVAFDGIQTSTRYPAGMALRFARVVRYREDKRPDEADTIDTVRSIHTRSL